MTPVEFYFDFASPYGFIAAMQIDAIARPVTWRPFLLGAVYKTFGQSPLEHPLKKNYVLEADAPRVARRIGLQLEVPAGFPEHALAPSRAFYWIEEQDPANAVAFAKLAYRKYWLEGCATSDAAVAADAAVAVRLRSSRRAGWHAGRPHQGAAGRGERGRHPQGRVRVAVLPG